MLAILGHAKPRPELIPAMTHPAEKVLDWWEYRARFVTPGRIAAGAEFWRQHAADLESKVVVAAASGFVLDDETRAAVGRAFAPVLAHTHAEVIPVGQVRKRYDPRQVSSMPLVAIHRERS